MLTNNASNMSLTIGSAGQMVMPRQPAFLALNPAILTNVSGDDTIYTCVFSNTIFDHGTNFSGTSFIAPVDGKFLFTANVTIYNVTTSHVNGVCSIVTTSNIFPTYMSPNHGTGLNTVPMAYICQAFCHLNAGDTAEIQLRVSGGTKVVSFNGAASAVSYFAGVLIC